MSGNWKGDRSFAMTDGYHEYERIFGMFPLIILANCMAHARRYFEEATNSKWKWSQNLFRDMQEDFGTELIVYLQDGRIPIQFNTK